MSSNIKNIANEIKNYIFEENTPININIIKKSKLLYESSLHYYTDILENIPNNIRHLDMILIKKLIKMIYQIV